MPKPAAAIINIYATRKLKLEAERLAQAKKWSLSFYVCQLIQREVEAAQQAEQPQKETA